MKVHIIFRSGAVRCMAQESFAGLSLTDAGDPGSSLPAVCTEHKNRRVEHSVACRSFGIFHAGRRDGSVHTPRCGYPV